MNPVGLHDDHSVSSHCHACGDITSMIGVLGSRHAVPTGNRVFLASQTRTKIQNSPKAEANDDLPVLH